MLKLEGPPEEVALHSNWDSTESCGRLHPSAAHAKSCYWPVATAAGAFAFGAK